MVFQTGVLKTTREKLLLFSLLFSTTFGQVNALEDPLKGDEGLSTKRVEKILTLDHTNSVSNI